MHIVQRDASVVNSSRHFLQVKSGCDYVAQFRRVCIGALRCLALFLLITGRFIIFFRLFRRQRLFSRQPKLLHQLHFLRSLPQFRLPVLALAGVLAGQRGRVTGQPRGLSVGLLGRIDVLVAIPELLVRRMAWQHQSIHFHRLGQPGGKDAVQHHRLDVGLLDPRLLK